MSRKLDAVVAEKVMGKCVTGSDYVYECEATVNPKTGITNRAYKMGPRVPNYSTYITDAWEVLAKFDTWTLEKNKRGKFVCMLPGPVVYISSTAPLAICLAALKSRGVPESEIEKEFT